MPLIVFY